MAPEQGPATCSGTMRTFALLFSHKAMAPPRRNSPSPKRRIAAPDALSEDDREALVTKVSYLGSGNHKRYPADYGLGRVDPRPEKTLCDLVRPIRKAEALALLQAGVCKGMVSWPFVDGFPKYVWSVSEQGEAFEAKTHPNTPGQYHGYPLGDDDDMQATVLQTWKTRT